MPLLRHTTFTIHDASARNFVHFDTQYDTDTPWGFEIYEQVRNPEPVIHAFIVWDKYWRGLKGEYDPDKILGFSTLWRSQDNLNYFPADIFRSIIIFVAIS